MKKILLFFFSSIGIFLLAGGIHFYYKNLRGIKPVIEKPPVDIGQVIDAHNADVEDTETAAAGDQHGTAFPLQLPPGFSMSIFARGLVQPRVMTWDPSGDMLVSIPKQGNVVALLDTDHDGSADRMQVVIGGLNKPHGLAFRGTDLFIAETNQLSQYSYDTATKKAVFVKKLIDLPSDGYNQHYTRTLLVDPQDDTSMLVSVGSSCNVCHETDAKRAKILSVDLANGTVTDYATGLRNSVFMTVEPDTTRVWATEMGRDLLGDNTPPDEINLIEKDSHTGEARNYGWPTCYGKNIHDTAFDTNVYIRSPCIEPFEVPSYIDLPAHSAPLGLTFVPRSAHWPEAYAGDLLVAYHGSWNRSTPTGYKIVRFSLDPVNATPPCKEGNTCPAIAMMKIVPSLEQPFISGWLNRKNEALGRPVDLLFGQDGALYISDDKAGLIYRVVYHTPKGSSDSGTP